MAKAKKSLIDKNLENFINANFDKNDRKKDESLKFEWFVNSMHIWQYSSQAFNSNSKIGKLLSLGNSQGGDAFFISINNAEQIFTITDNLDEVIDYIKKSAKSITFHFIQTKKSENAKWPDFLNLMDVPLRIWNNEDFPTSQPILKKLKDFIDNITDDGDAILKKIIHKIEICFYTSKNEVDIEKLRIDWNVDIQNQFKKLHEFFSKDNVKIELRGSTHLNDIYEKLNSNDYSLSVDKEEVREVDEKKYLIGFITAKELLDCIAPYINGVRTLYPDVFKNNIRLYLGRNSVNEKIEETLLKEPKKFHFYNNGLTITTKEIGDGNSKNYTISPVNIVNGCQTANSIFNVCKSEGIDEKSIKIPVKIIVAQDQEYENITIRTNTQNGIEAKDLVSITNIQKELERDFKSLNIQNKSFYYKRQKSSEIIDSNVDYIIQIDDILRAAFSTLTLIPHKVLGFFDQTTLIYVERIFDEKFLKLYSIVTVLSKFVEYEIEKNYPNYKRLNFHILYLLYRFSCKELNYKEIEEFFSKNEEYSLDEEQKLEGIINQIHSKLYAIAKSELYLKNILDYITNKIVSDYPDFMDLSSKEKERILYKPVEKIGRGRTEIFTDFNTIFSENLEDLKPKI